MANLRLPSSQVLILLSLVHEDYTHITSGSHLQNHHPYISLLMHLETSNWETKPLTGKIFSFSWPSLIQQQFTNTLSTNMYWVSNMCQVLYGQIMHMCAKSLQSCLTLCHPMDCSLPGSPGFGIFQARILEGVAMPSSRGSSQSRNRTHISYISWQAGSLPLAPSGKLGKL